MHSDLVQQLGRDNASVLIVDDTPENLQVLGNVLMAEGLDVGFATSGERALEAVSFSLPDIILLDIMMPGMDGFEVCRQLKAKPESKDIPVIFLTALTRPDDIIKGFEAGGVDYVTKPFNPRELVARVFTQLELKLTRDQIKVQNRELVELNATKNKFFSIIAHDLRGPFMGLLGLSDILVKEYEKLTPDETAEFNHRIHESLKNQYSLLENLLQWANMQTGRVEYLPVRLQVTQIIRDVFGSLLNNAEAKSILLNNAANERHYITVDRVMIRSVFHNLISNAIKFTPNDGRIDVISIESDDSIIVKIKDNGIGMSEETIKKLFRIDMHHSTPGTNKEKGSGLGLILCREMAERNNGSISVFSRQGQGTVFSVELPKAPAC